MSKLDGIKDFIEDNKEPLEKMNEEMKANSGKAPLVWLTTEEAGILTRCAANEFYRLIMERGPVDLTRQVEALMYDLVKRIKQAEVTTPKSDEINELGAKIKALPTTPIEVRLSVEMAEDLNSAINHLFGLVGLVKLKQARFTQGETIALRTFDDLVCRATSQFNQVVKKVIEKAEGSE